jgi:hypothetical protein
MGKTNIEGGELMIADELRELFNELKGELTLVRAELLLMTHDITQLRNQMDKVEHIAEYLQEMSQISHESIGIAPNTPGPNFVPIEKM